MKGKRCKAKDERQKMKDLAFQAKNLEKPGTWKNPALIMKLNK